MYEIFCGSIETMKRIAEEGVKALNPKTMRWQIVNKNAKYEIKEDYRIPIGDEIKIGATLLSNIDLRKEAEEKGLII